MFIEIHDNNTNETGTYKIWFTYGGKKETRICSETFANSLLNMRQKEDFFMGKFRFKIDSVYDIEKLIFYPQSK